MPTCTHCTLNSAFTNCHTDFNSPRATQCSGTGLVLKSSICFLGGIRFQKCTSCSFYQTSSCCQARDSREGLQTPFLLPGQYPGKCTSPEDAHSSQVPHQHIPSLPPEWEKRQARAPAQYLALRCVPETQEFPGTWQEPQNQV